MRNGANDTNARATKVCKSTLEAYEQPALDDAIRQELEEYVVRRRAELGDLPRAAKSVGALGLRHDEADGPNQDTANLSPADAYRRVRSALRG